MGKSSNFYALHQLLCLQLSSPREKDSLLDVASEELKEVIVKIHMLADGMVLGTRWPRVCRMGLRKSLLKFVQSSVATSSSEKGS